MKIRIGRCIPSVPILAVTLLAYLFGAALAGQRLQPGTGGWSLLARLPFWSIALLGAALAVLIALRMLADRRSRLDRDMLEAFLEHIPDHVYFKDRNSRFLRINRAMAAHFGLDDPRQAIRRTDADMFSAEHAALALIDEQRILRTGEPVIGIEEKETWPDGRENWVLTTKVPLRDRRHRVIGTMGISHNITARKEAEARIRHMALHDALTGLSNRTHLAEQLTQVMDLARRQQHGVAVLMLDLDRFKSVNDTYGHGTGDCLLQSVADRLRRCLRETDIIARLGGDEFVICLPEVRGNRKVAGVAQKILAALSEPFEIRGWHLRIGASVGICLYPADGETPEALLQNADAAMYEAKKKGRGTYRFFVPELTQEIRRRQRLEADLRQICLEKALSIHYQPLLSTASGHISAVEALLRWTHPQLGPVMPDEFVPILEDMDRMQDVGTWVLRMACQQSAAWQRQGLPPVRIAVNVSAQQFYRGNLVESVQSALREAALAPQWLELELTESLTLNDVESSIAIMQQLKQLGVSLSLDDFGTGWSTLSYLTRLPLDRIKMDRSFLRDIRQRPSADAVVKSILQLCTNLGVQCVAEGVETREQFSFLHTQPCAEVQGFLYSEALPAEGCARLLANPGFVSLENPQFAPPILHS